MIKNKTSMSELTDKQRELVEDAFEYLNSRLGSDVNGVVYCVPYISPTNSWDDSVNMTVKLDGYCVGYDMDFLYHSFEVLELLEIRTRYE